MNNDNKRWVALPQFLFLNKTPLKYQDALIYITLRSFLNSKTKECFPSYETIANKAGVSRTFVSTSLKRLKSSGMISSTTRKVSTDKNAPNQYAFSEFDVFEQIPYDIFDCSDLTYTEKAMLICIRQFFNSGPLETIKKIKMLATSLGLSYKTVSAQVTRLIDKGYIIKRVIKLRNGKSYSRYCLTEKLVWITGQSKQIIISPKPIKKMFKVS